jgi:predicted Zn-dependent peptidase
VILGDGMSSRLNVRLREKRGLAYSVYSQVQLFADCGSFSIYAGVDESRIATVHTSIASILSEIANEGVTASELARAKAQLRASKLMALESLSARMTMLGKGLLEDGAPEHPYATIASLEAVDLQGIARVATYVCTPDEWSRCMLLPSGEE